MPAPKGNDFWTKRTKHGRKSIFQKPEVFWKVALEYFAWCQKNPWIKKEAIKSGERAGQLIDIPTERPYTLAGLCIYMNVGTHYLDQFKKSKTAEKDEGFSEIITRVEEIIRTQKFEGATVGAFNANIIARDLGLVDKKDHTTDGESMNKGYFDLLKARRTKQTTIPEVTKAKSKP